MPDQNEALPLAYSMDELMSATKLSRTTLYGYINDGALRARKAGRRTIFLREDVDDFLRGLAFASDTPRRPNGAPERAEPVAA